MTTINPSLSASRAMSGSPGARPAAIAAEAQDRFLNLLVTQLKNQDPLNPLDNAQVTSQLAQLSTVNGINQLNDTVLALSGQIDASQSLQATGLIGRHVLVEGSRVAVGAGEAMPFGLDLAGAAARLDVRILDAAGTLVRRLSLADVPAGVATLRWDGLDDAGQVVPDGAYRVAASAVDGKAAAVAATALSAAKVAGVAHATDGVKLDLGLAGAAGLRDIRKVL